MRRSELCTSRFRHLALGLALASPLAAAAPSPMMPGLWEMRVTSTVARKTLPTEVTRECLTQPDLDDATKTLPRPDAKCSISNIETQGNRTTYDMACTRDVYTNRGRMELVVGTTNYDGMADMKVSAPGNTDTSITFVINGKRIGDCSK
jgi:Protein of unknown function (DUF3617)